MARAAARPSAGLSRWWPLVCGALVLASAGSGAASAQSAPAASSADANRPVALEATDDHVAVVAAPEPGAARRGTLAPGAVVPDLGKVRGEGCGPRGYRRIGSAAYACARALSPSVRPLSPTTLPPEALPHEYLAARREGVKAYLRVQDVDADEYETALARGFSVIARERVTHDGVVFVRTRAGFYVRERDLRPVVASAFHGVLLDPGETLAGVAFVIAERAALRDPSGATLRELPRLSVLRPRVPAASTDAAGPQLVLGDGTTVARAEVVQPEPATPPPGTATDEVWIDIDLQRQVLVAYRGARPVFATLISSGKPRRGTRTPRGTFRIWVKLLGSDMADRERPPIARSYWLESVPWVQYFEGAYGLHAAFWHDSFGQPMSRGCINLSPADARTLFELTEPELPGGWEAVLPPDRHGTVVVIR